MDDYRVNLEVYNGPLDLLLYLIRRDEVDIHDIPIARIAEQYIEYVNLMQQVDPNLAGEFLVMVATLIEIKTRMLLPARVGDNEDGEPDDALDPRAELVRQLLEYKAFKDAAGDLQELAEHQALRFPRHPVRPDFDDEDREMEDLQVWDLFDAFSKLLDQIGQQPTHHEVIYDDTPVELHAEDIVDRLHRDGAMSFGALFRGRTGRSEIIGLFLALLELVRQKRVLANQDSNFGDVWLHLREPGEDAEDDPESRDADESPAPAEPAESHPPQAQWQPSQEDGEDEADENDPFALPEDESYDVVLDPDQTPPAASDPADANLDDGQYVSEPTDDVAPFEEDPHDRQREP